MNLHAFFTDCPVWQIDVMFALFASLMIIFEDRSIKYADEFSMQC